MRRWIWIAVVALAVTPAASQTERGPWEVGLDFGFADLDSEVADESGLLLSFRGGYHIRPRFELEGQVRSVVAEVGPIDVALSSVMVNGVVSFRPKTDVVPYVLVGVGTSTLEYDLGGATIDDDGTSAQAAAGIKLHVGASRRHAVRIEALILSEETFDESSQHSMLSVGWLWRLGATRF